MSSSRSAHTRTFAAAAPRTRRAHSLCAAWEEGAELAVVYARGDPAYPVPKLLYRSLGFRAHARTITFTRRAGGR